MKIIHVTTSLGLGGAEKILFDVATGQRQKGHQVHVINLRSEEYYSDKLRCDGISVTALCKSPFTVKLMIPHLITILLKWPWICFKVRMIKPDIIHTWMYLADIYGGVIGAVICKPVLWGIFTGSVSKNFYSRTTYLMVRFCAFLSRCIPKVIVSCSAYGRASHVRIGYDEKKTIFVPTGFSLKHSTLVSSSLASKRIVGRCGELVIGMLARVSREKDHRLLLQAMARLINEGHKIRLILAGGVGLEKNKCQLLSVVRQLDIEDKVVFLGTVSDIDEFFGQIDIFALISKSEGFPTVVGQAMLYGLPCVVSNVGDARILLADSNQLVESQNLEQLVKLLKLYLNYSENKRRSIGDRNRQRIQTSFSKSLMLNRYDEVYEHLLDS